MTATNTRSGRLKLVGVIGVVAVVAVAAAVWWFLRDDAPEATNISDAAAQVTTTVGEGASADGANGGSTASDGPAAGGDVSGTWNVDTSIGEFSFEDSTGTFAGFRVAEELSGVGSTTAVGRTPEVAGTLEIDGTTVQEATIAADMTALTTNDSRRDGRARDALETDQFPEATFELTSPIELGAEATAGDPVAVEAAGDLTIHGVTKPVTFPLDAQLVDGTIVITGTLDVVFSDYGVEL
ncbi:MAG: YceI family protein, partial [Acidimicrobiia bacterium]|nr:YceI family protein [Acidimicrobiia bacterium]